MQIMHEYIVWRILYSEERAAGFFVSLIAGMGVLAKSGAKRAKLYAMITVAMDAWPALRASNVGQTKADNTKWPRRV